MLALVVGAAVVTAGWPAVAAAQADSTTLEASAADAEDLGDAVDPIEAAEDWAWRPLDDGRWTVPLEAIGFGEVQVPEAPGTSVAVDVAAVAELGPVGLTTEVVAGAHPVEVVATIDGVVVESFSLDAEQARRVHLDLSTGSSSVRFDARRLDDLECDVPERTGLLRLRRTALLTNGVRTAPSDIGEFLRPPIGRVLVDVPADRSPAVDAAVLEAAAVFARVAPGLQDFGVGSGVGDDGGPFDRRVRFVERDVAGLTLEDGVLTVAGRGAALADQVRALSTEAAAITGVDELVATTRADNDADAVLAIGEPIPVSMLAKRTRVEGAYHLELPIPLDQTAFEAPVQRYDVRLGGIASPPPGDAAQDTQLSLLVGGELVDVVEVERNGRFDVQFAVEGAAVQRVTTIVLVLDGVRTCGDTSQWTLQVDSGSWVSASGGQSLPPGFERFPQVAAAAVDVYPGRDLSDLALAATLVARLQEESVRALRIETVGRDEAMDPAGTLVAAGADQDLLETWAAPVIPGRRLVSGDMEISVDQFDHGLVVQAFVTTGGRNVLAANSGTPPDAWAAELLGTRWSAMRDAVAMADDGRLVFALGPNPATTSAPLLNDLHPSEDTGTRRLFVAGFSIMVTVAVFVLAVVRTIASLRRRMRERWAIEAAAAQAAQAAQVVSRR